MDWIQHRVNVQQIIRSPFPQWKNLPNRRAIIQAKLKTSCWQEHHNNVKI